jgi:YidC/Oxa1 family membrane protein insertase
MILVVLMVAAQFVSQKYTMASTQQNKMFMYILPLVIGFFFRTVAAGLVLYWTMFSVLTLADFVIFRRNKNPEVKTA